MRDSLGLRVPGHFSQRPEGPTRPTGLPHIGIFTPPPHPTPTHTHTSPVMPVGIRVGEDRHQIRKDFILTITLVPQKSLGCANPCWGCGGVGEIQEQTQIQVPKVLCAVSQR